MGEVYRARDTRLGRIVAVKILPPDVSGDPQRRARFQREARAAGALNHPNIASLYDLDCHGDIDFIISEFIDGESLRGIVDRGPIPVQRLVELATQIAAGLKIAHEGASSIVT
jgi:eukaryotic-like serine/threonine-protein kinase